jgi:hypothetical protein
LIDADDHNFCKPYKTVDCSHLQTHLHQRHDWATFDWSDGNIEQDDDRVCIPGQIVFFLEVTEEMVGIDVGGEMILPSTGLFALIESLEATKEKTSRWPFCTCAKPLLGSC